MKMRSAYAKKGYRTIKQKEEDDNDSDEEGKDEI